MSLLPPRLCHIWPPPLCGPSCSLNPNHAIASLAARTSLSQQAPPSTTADENNGPSSPAMSVTSRSHQYLLTMHPVLPWAAYVMESLSSGSTNSHQHGTAVPGLTPAQLTSTELVVQNIQTGEILWHYSWVDVAAILYGEENAGKLPSACKSLGQLVSLSFWDLHVLYWSGMTMTTSKNSSIAGSTTPAADAFDSPLLLVQTTHRCLVLRLLDRKAHVAVLPASNRRLTRHLIRLHVTDQTHGAAPTSNLLGISPTHYLVGCVDGSLKCFSGNQIIKSIKGLGKGDWIVRMLCANSYSNTTASHAAAASAAATSTTASSGTTPSASESTEPHPPSLVKRILTCTKKGSLYLIEIEIRNEPHFSLDIRPPLARFALEEHYSNPGGSTGKAHGSVAPHATIMASIFYDAHRDWVFASNPNTVWVWNLQALQHDLMAQQMNNANSSSSLASGTSNNSGTKSNVLKPDPTLTIHHLLDASTAVAPIPHSAFSSEVVVCGVATADGELYLQGAVAHPNNPVSVTFATPVQVIHMPIVVQKAVNLDNVPPLRIYDMSCQPLGSQPAIVLLTNVGLLVMEWVSVPLLGARHLHFGAGLGSLGKSVLSVNHSDIIYGSLDVLRSNPMGPMIARNPVVVYESPPTLEFADLHKRPFRLTPLFLPSPSGSYVALWWPCEYRFEILHAVTLLQKVGQRGSSINTKPAVARGSGILSFAWVGDEEHYAILHAPDLMEKAALKVAEIAALTAAAAAAALPMVQDMGGGGLPNLTNLKDIRASVLQVGNLSISATKAATNVTLNATKAATSVALNTTKAATSATLNVTKAATSTALNATKAATSATLNVTKAATSATANVAKAATSTATKAVRDSVKKGVKKSFGLFKKNKGTDDGTNATCSSIMEEQDVDDLPETLSIAELQAQAAQAVQMIAAAEAAAENASAESKRRWVELFHLEALELQASEISSGIAAATTTSVGELTLRGASSRNPPAMLFGGPVLCVATRSEVDGKGHAHFYTRKPDETSQQASVYVSSGPTLPFPDIVTWDDDGRLCAVVIQNRVAIYLSNVTDFVLLGMVRLSPSSVITSVKFVHGALYSCTWNAVYCSFLGDLESGICNVDTYALASAAISGVFDAHSFDECTTLSPPIVPLSLIQPVVLGYQSGSVIISTYRGIQALPLAHPLLRIGTLLAAGQVDRAAKWFDAVPDKQHEVLASFLLRRGHSDLALQLPGISLETIVDISMQYGYVGRLEEVVEDYGVKGLRSIDMGRGVTTAFFGPEKDTPSIVVCVGAYLLAHGRVELARQLATELVRLGEDGKKDALFLAALLMPLDENDSNRLIKRTVEDDGPMSLEWHVGDYVRKHVL